MKKIIKKVWYAKFNNFKKVSFTEYELETVKEAGKIMNKKGFSLFTEEKSRKR